LVIMDSLLGQRFTAFGTDFWDFWTDFCHAKHSQKFGVICFA
jgi:hypothetical protein